jgi:hypothetical protein
MSRLARDTIKILFMFQFLPRSLQSVERVQPRANSMSGATLLFLCVQFNPWTAEASLFFLIEFDDTIMMTYEFIRDCIRLNEFIRDCIRLNKAQFALRDTVRRLLWKL